MTTKVGSTDVSSGGYSKGKSDVTTGCYDMDFFGDCSELFTKSSDHHRHHSGDSYQQTRKNSFLISLQPDDEIYRIIDRLQCWYGHITSREGPT